MTSIDPDLRPDGRVARARSRIAHARRRAFRRVSAILGSPRWRRRALFAATGAAVVLAAGMAWDFRPTGTTRLAALVRPANTALTKWINTPQVQRPPISVPLASVTGMDVKIYNLPWPYGSDWDVGAAAKSYAQVVNDLHQYPFVPAATQATFERRLEADINAALKASGILEADLSPSGASSTG